MEEKDLRCKKTKIRMQTALLDLMKEKDYRKITVVDVAKYANINRKTFYDHYETIDDLYEEILVDVIYRAFAAFDETNEPNRSLENYRGTLIRFVEKVRGLGRAAEVFKNYMAPQCCFSVMKRTLAEKLEGHPVVIDGKRLNPIAFDVFMEAQADYMCAMIRSVLNWGDCSAEEIVDAMLVGWGTFDAFMQEYSMFFTKQ